jgi:hypothetical protein
MISMVLLLGSITGAVLATPAAQPETSGTLTVQGKATPIRYAYADVSPTDVILLLTDNPIPPERVPFGAYDMAQKKQIHGLSVTLNKETRRITDGAIFHEAFDGQLGGQTTATIELTRFDSGWLEGRLWLPKPLEFDGKSYSYDARFKVALAGKPAPASKPTPTIRGDDSPPVRAYATYYRALLRGDLSEVRKSVSKRQLPDLDRMGEKVLAVSGAVQPALIAIHDVKTTSDRSTFVAEGKKGKSSGRGSIVMILEDGAWKVDSDRWSFNEE